MGHGYKGGASHHHSISENLNELKDNYSFKNGYFGTRGQGRDFVRNIQSEDPLATAKDFYNTAAHGGIERTMENGRGMYTKMQDGTILSFREKSASDGTPVVEINIKKSNANGGAKYQKIHFIGGKKDE